MSRRAKVGSALLAAGAMLLVANGAYLAVASDPSLFHLANVLAHPLLALALLLPLLVRGRRPEGRIGAGGLALLGAAATGLALPAMADGGARQTLVFLHAALAVAGLGLLVAGLTPRTRGRLGAALTAAALAGAAVGLGRERGREGAAARPFVHPPAPASLAEEAMGGAQGPFYPSAAATAGGEPLPGAVFADADALCGRCHAQEAAEWAASAHRHSGLGNPFFRRAFEDALTEAGPAAARWCAGCHAPPWLLSGGLAGPAGPGAADPGGDPLSAAGVTCTVCHAARGARSTLGQGGYEVGLPAALAMAAGDSLSRGLHDLAIRLDPESHRRAFAPAWLGDRESSSAFCAACHRAHAGPPIGEGPHFPLFDDYGPWQGSTESGQGTVRSLYLPEPRGCVECHMPAEEDGGTGEAGRGGGRSHRFAAANTALPALAGDAEQLAAVTASLAGGAVTLDLFALAPEEGGLVAPLGRDSGALRGAAARRGAAVGVEVVVRARGVGHEFPGGKRDLHEIWLALEAVDEHGRTVFASGGLDADGEVDPGAHFFRARWIDGAGEPVRGHRPWAARAVVYDQRLEPSAAQVVHYRLEVPAGAGGALELTARLLHRKFPPALARRALAGAPGEPPELPVTVMAEARATLALVEPGAPLPAPGPGRGAEGDWERWNDYGIGLALQGDLRGAEAAFLRVVELAPGRADGAANLGRLAAVAGDVAAARRWLGQALQIDPGLARARHFLGLATRNGGSFDEALGHFRAAAGAYPRDRLIRTQLGNTLFTLGDHAAAAREFEAVLAVDPADSGAHFNLARIHRALGDAGRADHHQARFERFKADETAQERVLGYLQTHPDDNRERQRIHVHGPAAPTAGEAGGGGGGAP